VTLVVAPLRDIPVTRTNLRVFYRHVWIPPVDPVDPFHVQPSQGRWPTAWTLYAATSESVAWAEYCRNHADDVALADITGGIGLDATSLAAMATFELPVAARALYELECNFDALADLTSPWAQDRLVAAGFDVSSFSADGPSYGDCPELAGLTATLGWEAVIAPSAAWRFDNGFAVPIFAAGRPKIVQVRETRAAARPTIATAVAATYPSGERPAWLG
jgi:hypothetical protein